MINIPPALGPWAKRGMAHNRHPILGCFLLPIRWQKVKVLTAKQNAPKNLCPKCGDHSALRLPLEDIEARLVACSPFLLLSISTNPCGHLKLLELVLVEKILAFGQPGSVIQAVHIQRELPASSSHPHIRKRFPATSLHPLCAIPPGCHCTCPNEPPPPPARTQTIAA